MTDFFGYDMEKAITGGVLITFCTDENIDWMIAVPGNQDIDKDQDVAFNYLLKSLKNKEVERIFIWPGSHIAIYGDRKAFSGTVDRIDSEKGYFILNTGSYYEEIYPRSMEIIALATDHSDERPKIYK